MKKTDVHRLHLVTYENGMKLQQKLVEMRQRDEIDDQLLLLEHPPVITLGAAAMNESPRDTRRARASRCFYETTRGGTSPTTAPARSLIPILHLGESNRDVRKYVTAIEEVLIRTVAVWHHRGSHRGTARHLGRQRQDRRDQRPHRPMGHVARLGAERQHEPRALLAHHTVRLAAPA
jgi:lipoate-protein ligase B